MKVHPSIPSLHWIFGPCINSALNTPWSGRGRTVSVLPTNKPLPGLTTPTPFTSGSPIHRAAGQRGPKKIQRKKKEKKDPFWKKPSSSWFDQPKLCPSGTPVARRPSTRRDRDRQVIVHTKYHSQPQVSSPSSSSSSRECLLPRARTTRASLARRARPSSRSSRSWAALARPAGIRDIPGPSIFL